MCFKLFLECLISLLKDPEQVSVSVKKLKTLFKDSSSRLAMTCASITASYPLRRLGRSYNIVHMSICFQCVMWTASIFLAMGTPLKRNKGRLVQHSKYLI